MLKKNQAIYKLYSEDIAIAKQDYFSIINSHGMIGKNAKACQPNKSYCSMVCQNKLKVLKARKQIHYFYSTYSGYI
jgi:Cu(I)/Ag(I) efflux system membrane fusion protein